MSQALTGTAFPQQPCEDVYYARDTGEKMEGRQLL